MKNNKRILSLTIAGAIALSSSMPAMAAVTKHVVEDDGVSYEYTLTDLEESFKDKATGGTGELYEKYAKGKLTAVYDDKRNVYVSRAEVDKALIDAVTSGDKFDLDAYTELEETPFIEIEDVKEVDKDGNVIEDEEKEIIVESVSAINPTTVKVTFNKEVEALTTADVTVTNTKTTEKQFVKEVKLAEDKKSATVTLYNNLANKTTYNVDVKDAGNMDLNYTVGEAATVTAKTTQTVKASNDIDLSKLEYKVLDANGLDITDTTTVSFETTAAVGNTDDGKHINLGAGESAFVYVVVTKEDGTKVKSDRITVKAEALKAAAITEVTVATSAPTFTDKDYKQNLVLPVGEKTAKVYLAAEDQFGDTFATTGAEFESLDKSVALVDRTTGLITPLKEGTVPVKVTLDKVSKTVQLQVVANAKATSVELEEEVIKLSNKVLAGQSVKVQVNDQYGNVFTTASNPTVTVLTGKDLITADATVSLTGGKGTLNIAPKANATSGTATVEVKVSDTVKKVLTVNVTEAGAIDSYTVEGFEAKLDKNALNDKTESEFTLSVFPVDENGVKTAGAVNNAKYTIADKDGKEVVTSTATSTKIDAANNANLKAGETYTIAVKVGTLEVFKDTFTVENTSAKPSLVQKESSVVLNDDAKIDFSKLFTVNFEGKEATSYTVTAIEATSDNSAVATTFKATDAASKNVEFTSTKDGSATVILQSVELTIEGTAHEVKLNNVPVNVKVGIVAKAKLKTDAQTALSAVSSLTIDKDADLDAAQTKVDAAKVAIQEALDGGYTQAEVEAFTNYGDIATKQTAIDNQAAVNTEAAKITAEGITDLSNEANVKTQAQALVADGYTVSIESGDATGNSAIAETGVVTRPENSGSDVTGNVVFTVTKDGVTQEVTVELTVVKKEA